VNLTTGLDLLQETVKPLVVNMPDSETQVLIRRVLGSDGLCKTLVDVRSHPLRSWVPVELCGGSFEVRDE
jgi:hypothetical protein